MNPLPVPVRLRHAVRGVLAGLVLAGILLGLTMVVFLSVWGWGRFVADFWPLDNSRVGPNLCASLVVTILLVAHNEYRTASRIVAQGEHTKEVMRDLVNEVLHPTQTAEHHIAEDIHDYP